MVHLRDISQLENEFQAVLQSKTLVRYYFRELPADVLRGYYGLDSLQGIELYLTKEIPGAYTEL